MKVKIEKWSSEIETGIVWQDSHHEELLAKLSFFHQVIIAKKGHEQITQVFHFLEEYIEYHFEDEEKHMERFAYPEKEAHLREHKAFINELINFKDVNEIHTDFSDSFAMSLCIFLNQWVINHIKTHDMRLGLFLQLNE